MLIGEAEHTALCRMTTLVEQEGHEIAGAVSSGDELLAAVHAVCPDVVLVDIRLAAAGGALAVTRRLARQCSVPVILVTGSGDCSTMEELGGCGASGVISRPVTGPVLAMNLSIVRQQQDVLNRLRESESRFRNFFDNSLAGIYLCTVQGTYITVNDAFARMLGYDDAMQMLAIVKSADEQVYDESSRRAELCDMLRQHGEVGGFESKVYGRDGDMLWISEHCRAITGRDGALHRYEGVVIDMTARKDAEAREQTTRDILQSTIDALSDMVVLQDLSRNVIMTNKACGEFIMPGMVRHDTPVSGAASTPFDDFLADGEEHEASVAVCELDGAVFDSRVTPFRSPDGELIGAVEMLRCIDENKAG